LAGTPYCTVNPVILTLSGVLTTFDVTPPKGGIQIRYYYLFNLFVTTRLLAYGC